MPLDRSLVLALVLLVPAAVHARLVPCHSGADARRIAEALRQIQRSVDPCGESAEVAALLKRLERCAGYEICTSATADRNLFERRTITWNPDLRSEIEPPCDGAETAVRRDPIASLLHELVHAVHACEGLRPGEHELEAVRIENIYRRAAGLRQRTRYGDAPLPPMMVRESCADPAPTLDAGSAR
jgi:hypothetical protein